MSSTLTFTPSYSSSTVTIIKCSISILTFTCLAIAVHCLLPLSITAKTHFMQILTILTAEEFSNSISWLSWIIIIILNSFENSVQNSPILKYLVWRQIISPKQFLKYYLTSRWLLKNQFTKVVDNVSAKAKIQRMFNMCYSVS